jgi:hypothetical protein
MLPPRRYSHLFASTFLARHRVKFAMDTDRQGRPYIHKCISMAMALRKFLASSSVASTAQHSAAFLPVDPIILSILSQVSLTVTPVVLTFPFSCQLLSYQFHSTRNFTVYHCHCQPLPTLLLYTSMHATSFQLLPSAVVAPTTPAVVAPVAAVTTVVVSAKMITIQAIKSKNTVLMKKTESNAL